MIPPSHVKDDFVESLTLMYWYTITTRKKLLGFGQAVRDLTFPSTARSMITDKSAVAVLT